MTTSPESGREERNPETGRGWRFVPWSVVVFMAAALPLIVSGLARGRGQFDQQFFHEPTIRTFVKQWPRVDLRDYLSATTPGYHLVMAAVAKYVTGSLMSLKLLSMLFTVGLVWVLEGAVRGRLKRPSGEAAKPRMSVAGSSVGGEAVASVSAASLPHGPLPVGGGTQALALVLPMVCSMYVLMPGVWLQPDNAAWLGVLMMLLIALRRKWDELSLLGGALVMLLLVWTRQSHVWVAGVLWVGAWVADEAAGTKEEGIKALWHRGIKAGLAVLATMPAIACLAWFVALWGGLTPPEFQKQHAAGFNAATPAFALSVWAVLSVFFGAWVWGGLMMLVKSWRGWVVIGVCVAGGVLLAWFPATTFLREPRSSGLWRLVEETDRLGWVIAGRTSVVILLLAPAGGVALAGWLTSVARSGPDGRRCAWVYGLALVGFVAAQTANTNAWQRYLEPMFLMTMALMAAQAGWPRGRWSARLAWVGVLALAGLGAALTAYTLWSEPVVVKTW